MGSNGTRRIEMEHYELMMEGEKVRSLRGFKQRWIWLIETSAEANRQQYERLREEALRLRQHPGFKHMHQLFHLQRFGEWPVLFSAPCESCCTHDTGPVETH